IPKIETFLENLKENQIKVAAVVSDSAPAYAAARHRLRLKHRHIIFISCFAHQMNLCVGDLFKECFKFKEASKKVIEIIGFFNNPNNTYWIRKLRDEQKTAHKRYISLCHPCDTRWNSYGEAFSSLLKSKASLV
ncbi:15694_t:CDS:2, partial [Cetraspora pellucida]